MYALVFFADILGNAECMLLFVVRTNMGEPLDVRSANSTRTYAKKTDVRYFLGLPFG